MFVEHFVAAGFASGEEFKKAERRCVFVIELRHLKFVVNETKMGSGIVFQTIH